MTNISPRPDSRRARLARCVCVVAALWLVRGAAGQSQNAPDTRNERMHIAANESSLWVARLEGSQTHLFHRTPFDSFRRVHTLNGRIVLAAAVEDDLVVVLEDNSIFRYAEAGQAPAREIDLPARERPLQLLASGRTLYALIPSSLARKLDASGGTTSAPTTRPFDPGDAALSIATYDGRRWAGLAPCPAAAPSAGPEAMQARLLLAGGELLLLWAEPPQLHYVRLDLQTNTWRSGGTVGVPGLSGFWIGEVAGVPTLATVGVEHAEITAYRLLPDADAAAWRRGELQFSALPAGVTAPRVSAAVGFNQHVGLLVRDADGRAFVQFGRFAGEASEPTIAIDDALSPQRDALPFEAPLQVAMLLAVIGVFATVLLFRRGSITRAVVLPPQHALAYTTQRLAAWLIDFAPFTLLAAVIVGVGWLDALRHVCTWAINSQSEPGLAADDRMRIGLWWALSAGGYTLYALVMELTTGRTVGKLLLGVRLLSETGVKPGAVQIVIRNASRLLELLPPLWVLGFLALLTRNRQRVGDIFARTIAVRRIGDDADTGKRREDAARDERDGSND